MYVIWPALRTTSGTSDELSISSWSTEKENSSLLKCATVFDDRSAIDFKPLGPNVTITWLLLSSKFCAGDGEQRAIERMNSANAKRVTLGPLEHLRDCEGALLLACNWPSMVNVIVYNVAFSPVGWNCQEREKSIGPSSFWLTARGWFPNGKDLIRFYIGNGLLRSTRPTDVEICGRRIAQPKMQALIVA